VPRSVHAVHEEAEHSPNSSDKRAVADPLKEKNPVRQATQGHHLSRELTGKATSQMKGRFPLHLHVVKG
ncbi:hypothetical protein NFB41_17245, partial [Yersinia ruckeri]|uniref:hypothetical protein n=1 Tax=Yersinia ruckeri TaxID=29486 RepID=UPI002238AF3E